MHIYTHTPHACRLNCLLYYHVFSLKFLFATTNTRFCVWRSNQTQSRDKTHKPTSLHTYTHTVAKVDEAGHFWRKRRRKRDNYYKGRDNNHRHRGSKWAEKKTKTTARPLYWKPAMELVCLIIHKNNCVHTHKQLFSGGTQAGFFYCASSCWLLALILPPLVHMLELHMYKQVFAFKTDEWRWWFGAQCSLSLSPSG